MSKLIFFLQRPVFDLKKTATRGHWFHKVYIDHFVVDNFHVIESKRFSSGQLLPSNGENRYPSSHHIDRRHRTEQSTFGFSKTKVNSYREWLKFETARIRNSQTDQNHISQKNLYAILHSYIQMLASIQPDILPITNASSMSDFYSFMKSRASILVLTHRIHWIVPNGHDGGFICHWTNVCHRPQRIVNR